MEYLTKNKNLIIAFVLGLVIGFEGAWIALRDTEDEDFSSNPAGVVLGSDPATDTEENDGDMNVADQNTLESPTAPPVSRAGGDVIEAVSQSAGETVTIKYLVLDADGWAVIHEDERGRPGNILGARRFQAGEYRDVAIELLRATLPGAAYYAMIHDDDGVDTFDHTTDLPVTNSSGPLMTRFQTNP